MQVNPTTLTPAVFRIDGDETFCFAGFYDPAVTWNGWVCPYIYQHEVEVMRVVWGEDPDMDLAQAIADCKMPEDSPFLPIGSHSWCWTVEPIREDREFLLYPLRTLEQAEAFCLHLAKVGMLFHFDDEPDTVINGHTGEKLFTDAEVTLVKCRTWEVREIMGEPFSLPIALTDTVDGKVFRLQWLEGNGQTNDPEQDPEYLITGELAEKLGVEAAAMIADMAVTETLSPMDADDERLYAITRIA